MNQVKISTQPTRLAMNTQSASLDQRSQRAQFQMRTIDAQADIRQGPGRLIIDSSACRAAIGLKKTAELTRDIAQKGLQAMRETVSRYVQEGDRLAQISNPANTVAAMAADRNRGEMQPLSINWMTKPLPEVSYGMTPTRISWTPGQISFQVQAAHLEGSYTPGAVDTRVAQYADITIQVVEAGSQVNVRT